MKVFVNENGTPFKYDENQSCVVVDRKTGEAIEFTAGEIINFILSTGLWDGYHMPFNVLKLKNWIQFLKMSDRCYDGDNKIIRVVNSDGSYRSDFDIALEIRERINSEVDGVRYG